MPTKEPCVPAPLSPERLQEFKRIWKQEYDQELTDEEARAYYRDLAAFFHLLTEVALDQGRKTIDGEIDQLRAETIVSDRLVENAKKMIEAYDRTQSRRTKGSQPKDTKDRPGQQTLGF